MLPPRIAPIQVSFRFLLIIYMLLILHTQSTCTWLN
uniref:Prolyl-tRNA synthetase n=1 Tax=Arundo donax TaxID=35708 RepID=A0A0A9GV05_ARUDO